jgi:hypothetical protein
VSGHREEARRLYKSIKSQNRSILQIALATMILGCGFFNLARFEKWRIDRLNRKLLGS